MRTKKLTDRFLKVVKPGGDVAGVLKQTEDMLGRRKQAAAEAKASEASFLPTTSPKDSDRLNLKSVCEALLPGVKALATVNDKTVRRIDAMEESATRHRIAMSEPLDKYGSLWTLDGASQVHRNWGTEEKTSHKQLIVRQHLEGHFHHNPTTGMTNGLPYPTVGGVPNAITDEVVRLSEFRNCADQPGAEVSDAITPCILLFHSTKAI